MSSRFAARERRISAAIDGEYGERTRIVPRRRGEFVSASTDPDRPPRIVSGIASFIPKDVHPKDISRRDGMQPYIAADNSDVSYDIALFPAAADYPRQGDVIELMDRVPPMALTISAVDPDNLGRLVCKVMVSA
mgnify:CR=1 FL=1